MNTICIYYSRTKLTEQVAERLAKELDADIMEITDGKPRKGPFGYIGAAIVGLSKHLPHLLPFRSPKPLDEYDKIILLAPIWCEDVCPIMRSFIDDNRGKLSGEVFAVITHMGKLSYDDQIIDLSKYLGKDLRGYASVKTKNNDWVAQVLSCANIIRNSHKQQ
ncbi:MAG: hypothetical protein MJ148_01465 [Clostridia bacterium]|nr:hypothetical protein [Clostridia bacterium]